MGAACRVVDLGCEHGLLGAILAARGCRVIGVERRPALLQRGVYRGPAPRVVGDGFACLAAAGEVAVMAGMGERVIAAHLAAPALGGCRRLVLNPSPQPYTLRTALVAHGWRCVEEDLVRAGGRFHVCIAAERGPEVEPDPDRRLLGPRLFERDHPALRAYLEDLIARRPQAAGEGPEAAFVAAARRQLDLAP